MDPSRRSRFNPDEKFVGPGQSPDRTPSDSPIRRRGTPSRVVKSTGDVSKQRYGAGSQEDTRTSSGSRIGGRFSRGPVRTMAERAAAGDEEELAAIAEEDERIQVLKTPSQESVTESKADIERANKELFETGKIDQASFEFIGTNPEVPLNVEIVSKSEKGTGKEALKPNEDSDGFLSGEGFTLTAVADGHGDNKIVAHLATTELLGLTKDKMTSGKPFALAFDEALKDMQRKIQMNRWEGGACLIAAHLDKKAGVLTVATLGDAEAMVIRDEKANKLSLIRDWNHPEEQKRATPKHVASFAEQKEQGVDKPRIESFSGRSVNFSRSLGDRDFHRVVSQTPLITQVNAKPGDLLILASDGLWDVMTYDDVKDIVMAKPADLTQALIDKAKEKGSTDDITVQIVSIK